MAHKTKGCAGLGHHFLEEQQLPAKKGERGLVMGQIQTSSNKSAHVHVFSHPEAQRVPKSFRRYFEPFLDILKVPQN